MEQGGGTIGGSAGEGNSSATAQQQLSSIPGPGSGTGGASSGGGHRLASGADRCGAAAAASQRGGAHRAPHLQRRRTALRRCAPPPHRLHRPAPAAPCRHRAPAGEGAGGGGVPPPHLPPQAAGAVRCSHLRLRGQMEVAWALLQPCLLPELLQKPGWYLCQLWWEVLGAVDAGTAAVRGGHVRALAWLMERCPTLVDRKSTLLAAAQHCTLTQLREVWRLLLVQLGDGGPGEAASDLCGVDNAVLDAAARSTTPDGDAVSKMEWVLGGRQRGGDNCTMRVATAAAAASSGGGLARLQWPHQRGCPCNSPLVLEAALRHADCSVADGLVDQGGCPLSDPNDEAAKASALEAAAAGGRVASLLWLQARGVVSSPLAPAAAERAMRAAAAHGQLDMVRSLLHHDQQQRGGDGDLLSPRILNLAVTPGSVDTAAYLCAAGCPLGEGPGGLWQSWYISGCKGGLAMVRWFLQAGIIQRGTGGSGLCCQLVYNWPRSTIVHDEELLEAVRCLATLGGDVPGDKVTIPKDAAQRGDPQLMCLLQHTLGCELGGALLPEAAWGGGEAAVEWLVQRGCAAGDAQHLDACYLEAGARGNAAALACLRRLGVPCSGRLIPDALLRHLPVAVIQWLRQQGAPLDGRALEEVARRMEASGGMLGPESSEVREAIVEWLRGTLRG